MGKTPTSSSSSQKWGGKVLLAGEYTVTCGGTALAVCLDGLAGGWQTMAGDMAADSAWIKFGQWVATQDWPWLNQQKWQTEFRRIKFVSDLPPGIGLGSSGALCAAIYDRFAHTAELAQQDDVILQKRLAALEGYFHGVSSGLDPLVCLRQKAYLVHDKLYPIIMPRPWHLQKWPAENATTTTSSSSSSSLSFFLWDCGIPRETKNLMPHFQTLAQTNPAALTKLKQAQQNLAFALAAQLQGTPDPGEIIATWQMVADLEAQYLAPMIPPIVQKFWPGEKFHLKLCGAGGGGCFLGLALALADLRPLMAYGPVWKLIS